MKRFKFKGNSQTSFSNNLIRNKKCIMFVALYISPIHLGVTAADTWTGNRCFAKQHSARTASERDVTTIISDDAVSNADGKQWRSRQT